VEHRQAWLSDHAETFAYRDELTAAVAERRHELRLRAAITQPAHVVAIIGSVPIDSPEATQRWITSAARIEAYREEWSLAPETLRQRPRDACQERARPIAGDSELAEAVKVLARAHQSMIWTRQRQANQLRSTLRESIQGR
jgi:hypothetical protein